MANPPQEADPPTEPAIPVLMVVSATCTVALLGLHMGNRFLFWSRLMWLATDGLVHHIPLWLGAIVKSFLMYHSLSWLVGPWDWQTSHTDQLPTTSFSIPWNVSSLFPKSWF